MPSSTRWLLSAFHHWDHAVGFQDPLPSFCSCLGSCGCLGLSLAAVRQFSSWLNTCALLIVALSGMSFPFGLICPDLKPISKAGPGLLSDGDLHDYTILPPLLLHRQQSTAFVDSTHCSVSCLLPPPMVIFLRSRSLAFLFFFSPLPDWLVGS